MFIRWPSRAMILYFQGHTVKLLQIICQQIELHIRGIINVFVSNCRSSQPGTTCTLLPDAAHVGLLRTYIRIWADFETKRPSKRTTPRYLQPGSIYLNALWIYICISN